MFIPSNFRLGYACICTELRKNDIFASRTVRLSTLKTKGVDYVKKLALQNLTDLLTILIWNKEHDIHFMRLSSEMFPFASHLEHGYSLDFADTKLKEIGKYARDNNMRLTMHPGQYDVLSSPNEKVILNTISDLVHHCDILDRMEMGPDSVMIIHGGGVYNDKNQSLKRLEENFKRLPPNVQNRVVLENCEMAYCVEDLLNISESLQIPIVLDFHHDDIHQSSQPIEYYFDRVFAVWHKKGIKPKVHVSNSVPGITINDSKTLRRKHSDYISFLHKSLLTITFPLDVMLECKMKEQAIFQIRKIDLRDFFSLKTKNFN
jgi:UV DNA damage endonuclease